MHLFSRWAAAVLTMVVALTAPTAFAEVSATPARQADFAGQRASDAAREVADWAVSTRDHRDLPFALVDKAAATLYLFGADGRLLAASPALLGAAPGDDGAPGLNQRDLARLPLHERTTPAGRFEAQPGRNLQGEHVVWVDYGAALAIHRLRPAPARERRPARLASTTPHDNRISLGCVVVPAAFYEQAVLPLLGAGRSVVYILPESRALRDVFGWY